MEANWRRLRRLWRPSVRDEVDEEVAFHFAMRVQQFLDEGSTPAEAERRAREVFGDVAAVRDRLVAIDARNRRRADIGDLFDAIRLDARQAARALRQSWTHSLLAVGVLAVGIGASTAVFSVVNTVLLRPLPYAHPERLGYIMQDMTVRGVRDSPVAPGDLPDLRAAATRFESIAALGTTSNAPLWLPGSTVHEPVVIANVTPNLFDVLGVPAAFGRTFVESDARPSRPPNTAQSDATAPASLAADLPAARGVLGHEFWLRRFHGDSSVIGSTLIMAGRSVVIVGVASPDMELLYPASLGVQRHPDLWIALTLDFARASREVGGYRLLGRLAPGVSVDAAREQIDSIGRSFGARFPIRQAAGAQLRFEPMSDYLVSDVRPAILALMGAVLLFLLIACADVANLLLVRGAAREKELAVRAAIGGSPWRIVRQLLGESALLATFGAVIGIGLAAFGIAFIVRIAPATVPRIADVALNGTVLVFAIAAAAVSTLVFGLAPALRVAPPRFAHVLRATGAAASRSTTRFRAMIVVVEVALSFVLLIGCGLMVRSFVSLMRTDLGFDPGGVVTFHVSNFTSLSPREHEQFILALRDELGAIPGVTDVSLSTAVPLTGDRVSTRWGPLDAAQDQTKYRQGNIGVVLRGYFRTLSTPLVDGRDFTVEEERDRLPVTILSEDAARHLFGNGRAIGQKVIVRVTPEPSAYLVVGVAKSQRHTSFAGNDLPILYFPFGTTASARARWVVRTTGDVTALAPSIRAAVRAVNPTMLVTDIIPASTFVDRAMAGPRFSLALLATFAGIAALLAAVGLYGVLSSSVRQRTAEIGVRMAFGADARDIVGLVIRDGLRLSVIGLAIGVALALVATRAMSTMLFGVRPTDAATFLVTALVFIAIASVACWLPARRAAGVDPNVALREGAL